MSMNSPGIEKRTSWPGGQRPACRKPVVVSVDERTVTHPRVIKSSATAHESQEPTTSRASVMSVIACSIVECRPLSRDKRWRVSKVLERGIRWRKI